MDRNTALLQEIVTTLETELDDTAYALARLESHFHDALLVNAGNVSTIGGYAEQLRLNISQEECSTVLDYVAEKQMVLVTIDIVEDAINERFGWDRFIEP